jgi:hypothetical protein
MGFRGSQVQILSSRFTNCERTIYGSLPSCRFRYRDATTHSPRRGCRQLLVQELLFSTAFMRGRQRMLLPPALHRPENRPQLSPLRRQKVLEPRWMHLVGSSCNDSVTLQALQARREHARREARQPRLEILKAPRVVPEQIAQNQDRPSVTYDIERARNGTFEVVLPGHLRSSPTRQFDVSSTSSP